MKVIVYDQGQGKPAAILRPTESAMQEVGIDEIARAVVPEGAAYEVVEEAEIPGDRVFRNAWRLSAGAVGVGMTKAVEIHKDNLRAIRAPLLAASDVEFIRAIETRDLTLQAQIAARKQALRDVTADPSIAAARTPEELKAAVPAVLKG